MPRELYSAFRAVCHRFVRAQNNKLAHLNVVTNQRRTANFIFSTKKKIKSESEFDSKRTTQLFTKGVLTEKFRTEEFDFQSCESYFDIKEKTSNFMLEKRRGESEFKGTSQL